MVRGQSYAFECVVDDLGDEDYYVVWYFHDSDDIIECGKSTVCNYTPQCAGQWVVTVMVMDNADPGLPIADDSARYWVLWVDLSLITGGDCPAEDNEKREAYCQFTRNPSRDTLGPGQFWGFAANRLGWGVALRGEVTPSQWDEPINFDQYCWGIPYGGPDGTTPGQPQPNGEPDVEDYWVDHNAPVVYLLDMPGPTISAGEIRRQRAYFHDWAHWGGRQCSNEVQWHSKVSWIEEDGVWVLHADVAGDNETGPGAPIPLSWDLQ
ncbi:MAG: hypothetical protein J7M38_07390 [Armatimonadetes bacterium]|nr:hypothetical protein [Armatimonadota bacterium]